MAENMTNYFIFRDARLLGNLPLIAGSMITSQLDAATPLSKAFERLKLAYKSYGILKTLFILCHGKGSGFPPYDFWWHGGLGLQLGSDGLDIRNVSQWSAIKGCVENIVVYACGAAYSGPAVWYEPRVENNGRALMSALAKNTGAMVFAADKIQWYYPDLINFGKWEGTVYMFTPFGFIIPNFPPPTEVIDVISPLPKPELFTPEYIEYLKLKEKRISI